MMGNVHVQSIVKAIKSMDILTSLRSFSSSKTASEIVIFIR